MSFMESLFVWYSSCKLYADFSEPGPYKDKG